MEGGAGSDSASNLEGRVLDRRTGPLLVSAGPRPPDGTAARAGVCHGRASDGPDGRQTGTQHKQSSFAGLIGRIICTFADHRLLADSPAALAWCKPTLTRILEPGLSKLCLS